MKTLSLEQMESINGGLFKMPCGVALALYGVAFIGLCAASGPFAITAIMGFGATVYDVFASCLPD